MRFGFSWLAVGVCLFFHPNVNLNLAQSANILAIFPFHYGSPFLVARPLIKTLVKRGYNVTLISPQGLPPNIKGVRHIRVHKLNKRMQGKEARESLCIKTLPYFMELNKPLYFHFRNNRD